MNKVFKRLDSPSEKFKKFLKSFDKLKYEDRYCYNNITEILINDSVDNASLIS